jgi:hypothetical protein
MKQALPPLSARSLWANSRAAFPAHLTGAFRCGFHMDAIAVNRAVDTNKHCRSTSLFQFPIFADVLSVGHGLNANIQNAMKFKPGIIASKHQIA